MKKSLERTREMMYGIQTSKVALDLPIHRANVINNIADMRFVGDIEKKLIESNKAAKESKEIVSRLEIDVEKFGREIGGYVPVIQEGLKQIS